MKKFLAFLFIVFLGVWGYRSCANKKAATADPEVLKQVKVTAVSANLRTGPGTSYDFATVNADGTGGKWKVKRGTVLEVIQETAHWYEVRLIGDTRTAYIKKTLCADYDQNKDKTSGKNKKEKSSSPKKADNKVDQPSTNNADNDVVEEVTKGKPQDDEVIF